MEVSLFATVDRKSPPPYPYFENLLPAHVGCCKPTVKKIADKLMYIPNDDTQNY